MNASATPILPKGANCALACVAAVLFLAACDNRNPNVQSNAPAATSVGTDIDDTVVTSKVKSALLADPDVKSLDLKVETRSGEVMLSGFVANQGQVDRALNVAGAVAGVKSVSNKMDLKGEAATVGTSVDDSIMTTKIKSSLLADPGIKSFDIAVVTRRGEAQLSGFVDTQAQIDHASRLAGAVQGVTSVANGMSVKK